MGMAKRILAGMVVFSIVRFLRTCLLFAEFFEH